MAYLESAHDDLRVGFALPGVDRVIRESLGIKDTVENRRWARASVLKPLEREIAARDYAAILRRFPDSKRLRQLTLVQDGTAQSALTVDGLLDLVLRDYEKRSLSNAKHMISTIKPLKAFFAGKRAQDVTPLLVDQYVEQRLAAKNPKTGRPYKRATINAELAALIRGFTIAVEEKQILPAAPRIKKFTDKELSNARKGFFEAPELGAMLEYLPDYVRPVVLTLYLTGWRVSEVLSRKKQHVDLTATKTSPGWLRLEPGETKNREGRQFPLNDPALRALLTEQLEKTRELEKATGRIIPWLFHRNGEPIRKFRKAWDSAVDQAMAAGVMPERRLVHDLRRTAVRNLTRNHIDRHRAQQITGHKSGSVFDRYDIVDEATLAEVGARMAAASPLADILRDLPPAPKPHGRVMAGYYKRPAKSPHNSPTSPRANAK